MSCELVQFVLVEPSHAGNVGATARAMKTMGFTSLCLVAPKDREVLTSDAAIAMASGADDVLRNAQICTTLEEALADSTIAIALSARPRELSPRVFDVRQGVQALTQLPDWDKQQISLVFGTERTGLTNPQVAQCHALWYVASTSGYTSLNLAQAVQLVAYELRYLMTADAQYDFARSLQKYQEKEPLANHAMIEQLLLHWEQALLAIGFLDPEHPKRLMPRFQRLFLRSQLQEEEVSMLRGVCKAMVRTADKKTTMKE